MAIIYVFAMAFCLFGVTSVESITSNTCLVQLETKKDFDAKLFGGQWYQAGYYRYSDDSSVANPCIEIKYDVTTRKECTFLNFLEKQKTSRDATSYMPNSGRGRTCKSNKLSGRFMVGKETTFDKAHNEWILETDYKSYAVVHRCSRQKPEQWTFYPITILTREQIPSQSTVDEAKKFVEENISCKLPNELVFERNDQTNC